MTDDFQRELSGAVNQMYQDCPISDLIGEAMSEPPEEENLLQSSLVNFRNMAPAMQRDFLAGVMTEYLVLARENKIDKETARQVLFRAELVASFLNIPQPGKLKMVVNRG